MIFKQFGRWTDRPFSHFVPVDPKFKDFDWLTTGPFHVIPPSVLAGDKYVTYLR